MSLRAMTQAIRELEFKISRVKLVPPPDWGAHSSGRLKDAARYVVVVAQSLRAVHGLGDVGDVAAGPEADHRP
jgi:hypothetical protein